MRWLAAALIVVAAGCGGGRAPLNSNNSLAQSRLAQAETRAAAFVKTGDYGNAARQYAEALRVATMIENSDAIAANAINLSVVEQWLGRDAEARAALDAVLAEPHTAFPERRMLQAELRRAIVELAGGNLGAAAVWAGQAERRCAATHCDYAATILNVRAQVELDSGRAAEAASLAQTAGERLRAIGNLAEQANALRTLGRARQLHGDAAAALEPLRQALDIDRKIGDPRRILADLAELERASNAAGDAAAAKDYRERGRAVSRAMDGSRGLPEASLTR